MSLANLLSFNLTNIRNDFMKRFDINTKKEKVPLNLSKEAVFTVQVFLYYLRALHTHSTLAARSQHAKHEVRS